MKKKTLPTQSIKKDFSYFRLKNQNEGYIDTIEQLQDENDELFDENEQLKEKVELLSKINTTLEKEVRREMVEEMKVALQRKEKAVEERMQIRIDYLMKKHAEEVMVIEMRFSLLLFCYCFVGGRAEGENKKARR